MKITRKPTNENSVEIRASGIPVGTVFDGLIGTLPGPFLRSHEGIVRLEHPRDTWGVNANYNPPVHYYLPLDVELIVHGPAE